MKLNSIRYIVVSLVALLAVVGTANAVGVFYFDSATNQFVLDGNLKISDPGSFKLFLRELNSSDDSNLYINGRKDVQIRIDSDNNNTSLFKINNGANQTKFSVDENGATRLEGGLTIADGAGRISVGKYDAAHPNGYISGAAGAGLVLQSEAGNDRVIVGPSGVQFPSATTNNQTVTLKNGRVLFTGGLDSDGPLHTWAIAMSMGDGYAISWGGGWGFGHTTSGWYWGNSADYKLSLDNSGNLYAYGSVNAPSLCIGGTCRTSWPAGGTGGGALTCTVTLGAAGSSINAGSWFDTYRHNSCPSGQVVTGIDGEMDNSNYVGIYCSPITVTCS